MLEVRLNASSRRILLLFQSHIVISLFSAKNRMIQKIHLDYESTTVILIFQLQNFLLWSNVHSFGRPRYVHKVKVCYYTQAGVCSPGSTVISCTECIHLILTSPKVPYPLKSHLNFISSKSPILLSKISMSEFWV